MSNPSEWVSDYYIFNLIPTLTDLGASDSEASKLLPWFWETAPNWIAGCSTARDFATYARTRLRIKLHQTKVSTIPLALQIIDKLFADEDDLELRDVLDAVALIVPSKTLPFDTRVNGDTMLVGLGDALILKCDKQFFVDVLKQIYPFEIQGTKHYKLVKRLPMGAGVEREVNIYDLACWHRFPTATKAE